RGFCPSCTPRLADAFVYGFAPTLPRPAEIALRPAAEIRLPSTKLGNCRHSVFTSGDTTLRSPVKSDPCTRRREPFRGPGDNRNRRPGGVVAPAPAVQLREQGPWPTLSS